MSRKDVSVAATPAAANADPDAPFMVKATMGGTYPDPGGTQAKWRNIGDAFLVKCAGDFSVRWMRRMTEAEVATGPQRSVPQTTGKNRKLPTYSQLV